MSRDGSSSRRSVSSYHSSSEPRIPISCNLHTWQRLQSLARAIKTNDERLQVYKEDISNPDTGAQLVEAYNLEAEINNLRVTNEMKSKRVEQLRRMCAKKRLDISKLNEEREAKLLKEEEMQRLCNQSNQLISKGQKNLDLKRKYLNMYTNLIRHRTRYIVADLREIFRIELRDVGRKECTCKRIDTICGIHLPPLNALVGHVEVELSAALGHVVHLLDCVSKTLDYPFRYPVELGASTSHICSPREDKRLPLFGMRWKADRDRLDAALTLLGRDVAQLRADTGLQSPDLNRILQAIREWMEIVVHGRGQISYHHRPWLQVGTPALLMDSLDDSVLRPLGSLNNNSSPTFSFIPLRTSSALDKQNAFMKDEYGNELDASVLSSLHFEDSQREVS